MRGSTTILHSPNTNATTKLIRKLIAQQWAATAKSTSKEDINLLRAARLMDGGTEGNV